MPAGDWNLETGAGFVDFLKRNRSLYGSGSPFLSNVWVNRCIGAIATVVASLPGTQFLDVEANSPLKDADKRAWFARLLSKPNPLQSRTDFLELTSTLMDVDGVVFWIGERFDGGRWAICQDFAREQPERLYAIRRQHLRPIVTPDGQRLIGWEYQAGLRQPIAPGGVIRLGNTNPYNLLDGYSPLEVIRLSLDADRSAQVFNKSVFDTGGQPGGILKYPRQLSDEQINEIEQRWRDKHGGADKAGGVVVLDANMDYQATGKSNADMQFLDLRKFSRDEVFALFGVPKTLAGLYEDVNFATHLGQMAVFYETVIMPRLARIQDAIMAAFPGVFYFFDLSNVEALRVGTGEKIEQAAKLTAIGVPLTDALGMVGLEPKEYPWSRTWWKPFSQADVRTELGPNGEPKRPEPAPAPEPEPAPNEPQPQDGDGEPAPDETGDEENGDGGKAAKEQADGIDPVPVATNPRSTLAALIRVRGKLTAAQRERNASLHRAILKAGFDPAEAMVGRLYAKLIDGIQEQTRERFAAATGTAPKTLVLDVTTKEFAVDDVLFDRKEWEDWLIKNAPAVYRAVGVLALEQLGEELGGMDFSLNDPRFDLFLQEKTIKAKTIVKTMHEELRAVVSTGLKESQTVDEIADAIGRKFGVTRTRAATIARTETAQAMNGARGVGMKAEGVEMKLWSTSEDEKVRPTHVRLGDLDAVKLDHDWAEDIGASGRLLHPSDMRGPGEEVINCRCVSLAADRF